MQCWEKQKKTELELRYNCDDLCHFFLHFHQNKEVFYVFKDVCIILAAFKWNWPLLSYRRQPVVSQSKWTLLSNGQLLNFSFRPINSEPRHCTTHSTLSGVRPWPTTASQMKIWSEKHSGTINFMFHVLPEWQGMREGRHGENKRVMEKGERLKK